MHPIQGLAAYNPIHKWQFAPLPVVAAVGRSATMTPQVAAEHTIFSWFMDPLLFCFTVYRHQPELFARPRPSSPCLPGDNPSPGPHSGPKVAVVIQTFQSYPGTDGLP